ncbi:MAG: hypothetical protein QHH18_04410 [Candidatus Bathyarchaeota archaeon]|jgi:hypothetical protein|nr:hypothetical protein [Candidatus Bathyarchaeota archaeon A05DMB-5]MDH7557830.1 hypothetical protein [Candidatus Bathyarchaeota archaeon]
MKEISEKNGLENIFKLEDVEILAPIKRRGLPCSKDKANVCLDANCKRRIYTLTKAQLKKLELAQELTDEECTPSICEVEGCKKRLYPKFIKLSFCIKAKCPNLQRDKVQCKLKPKPKGRFSLERKGHTLRMHKGTDKGWFYRKMK